jgi:hypothetical protein
MPQKSEKFSMTILTLLRAADPLREVLREYASVKGFGLLCYSHLYEALSRMPLANTAGHTLIIARPEGFSLYGPAAFETLVSKENTHYLLWLDHSEFLYLPERQSRHSGLHRIHTIRQLDAFIEHIDKTAQASPERVQSNRPTPPRRPLSLQTEPLSNEELDALLGVGL